ncbi:MAG: hypothetical protein WAM66_08395 [Acidobacteriaceae bacterium]
MGIDTLEIVSAELDIFAQVAPGLGRPEKSGGKRKLLQLGEAS